MEKESKVTGINFKREWQSKTGQVNYTFEIEFENGDKGEFSTNKNPQSKFSLNKLEKYTIEEKEINTQKGVWKRSIINKPKQFPNGFNNLDFTSLKINIKATALHCSIILNPYLTEKQSISKLSVSIINHVYAYTKEINKENDYYALTAAYNALNITVKYIQSLEVSASKEYNNINKFYETFKSFATFLLKE